jgi:hypothetical protein
MKKTGLLLCFLLVGGISLHATIRIVAVRPTSSEYCEGSITIEATGSAGPFRIQLLGAGGFLEERSLTGPIETFSGLCTGAYTVLVYNALGCAKTLYATVAVETPGAVAPVAAPNAALPASLPEGNRFSLRARPNPFSADFQLDVFWDRPEQETLHIEVFNALGQLVHTRSLDAVSGQNTVSIQPTGPNAGGLLHILARDASGRKAGLRVVQVKE